MQVLPQLFAGAAQEQEDAESSHHIVCDAPDLSSFIRSSDDLRAVSRKSIRMFYERQNEFIASVCRWRTEKLEAFHRASRGNGADELASDAGSAGAISSAMAGKDSSRRAMVVSFYVTILLLSTRIVATVFTPSLLLIAAVVDGIMDFLSGAILYATSRLMQKKKRNVHEYPVGVSRMETLAVLAFALVMCTASIEIVQEGITRLVGHTTPPVVNWITLALLLLDIVVKNILWGYCGFVFRVTGSWSVEALRDDHRNDVCVVSLVVVGIYIAQIIWWLDAVGAIVIALLIIRNWIQTSAESIKSLAGGTAPNDVLQMLTFIASHHDDRILLVDTVRAYRTGNYYWAEIDITVDPEMKLRDAHDIGESLQHAIEAVDGIERAFVHIDYESNHHPASEHKRVL